MITQRKLGIFFTVALLETFRAALSLGRATKQSRVYQSEAIRFFRCENRGRGAKLLTRVGMGLCQGRLCGDNVARVIASARNL